MAIANGTPQSGAPRSGADAAIAGGTTISDAEVLCETRNQVAIITLNRPAALNALSFRMLGELREALRRCAADTGIRAVVLRGAGDRAFCAGGDIRALYQSFQESRSEHLEFFIAEYALDYSLHRYPKPYIALMDGITMGGGMGIAQGSTLRVVGERTRIAMPEVGIGLFPDVGASYFLSRLDGSLGAYLALTGVPIRGVDAVYAGLADVFLPPAAIAALADDLGALRWTADRDSGTAHGNSKHDVNDCSIGGSIHGDRDHNGQGDRDSYSISDSDKNDRDPDGSGNSDRNGNSKGKSDRDTQDLRRLLHESAAQELPAPSLSVLRPAIDHHFARPSVEQILASLDSESRAEYAEWAQQTAKIMRGRSPTMMSVALQQLQRGKTMGLAECFRMEAGMVEQCFAQGDVIEGIRALIIDKDNAPRWNPSRLEQVTDASVNAFFRERWHRGNHPLGDLERTALYD